MNTISFCEFRSEQTGAGYIFKENKIISLFNNILPIYLNEKLNFYHPVIERNAQMPI